MVSYFARSLSAKLEPLYPSEMAEMVKLSLAPVVVSLKIQHIIVTAVETPKPTYF
jgi:hypothetical protein